MFIGDTDHGDVLKQISEKLITKGRGCMPEIWANNSVSVSEVCISEGGDVTMSSSTCSSRQQILTTSDVYCLLDNDNDT